MGLADNFFHLGGHSLMATRLAAQVRSRLGRELPIRTIFETPVLGDLARFLATGSEPLVEAAPLLPDPAEAHAPFPLTPVQEAYWLGRQSLVELGEVACHVYAELRLRELDLERFTAAWRAVIGRHPMLRAVIAPDGTQRILAQVPPFTIAFEDYSQAPAAQAEAAAGAVREAMSHQVLPSDRWPLFEARVTRLAPDDWRLHLSIDALILDGESNNLLLQEVFDLYQGRTAPGLPAGLTFRDYVLHLHAPSPAAEQARAYWQARLDTLPPAPALPLAVDPSRLADARFGRHHARLHPAVWNTLKARAAAAGLTPSNLLLTAYAEVLGTWARSDDFTLNLTVGDRRPLHPEVAGMLGVFTNLTPLEIRGACRGAFRARAHVQQQQLARDLDHRAVSGVEVQRLLAQRAGDPRAGLLPVVFTSVIGEAQVDLPPEVEVVHSITQTPQTWLDHKVYELDGGLGIDWDAPLGLFPEGLLDAMLAAFVSLLGELATSDAAWETSDRSLVPAAERALISSVNSTAGPLPADLLHEPVFAAAQAHPEATAVIGEDYTLNLGELTHRALALSHRLQAILDPADQLVAIVMEKSCEQIVAALAVLETGRTFLPISAGQPDQRIRTILHQAGARIAITQQRAARGRFWQDQITLLEVTAEPVSGALPPRLPRTATPDDPAYVIYTSGSTGVPKGVTIQHRAARNTLADLTDRFAITSADRVLWVSSLEFDLSIFDLFAILGVGGAVVVPPAGGHQNPLGWAQAVHRHGVTIWNSVPALAELMLSATGNSARALLASLRLLMLSGDWIPVSLPGRFQAQIPACHVYSLGGATEASIWSIFHPIDHVDPHWVSIPYGKPLRNQPFHVLKDDFTPCPIHTTGKLFIGGAGLALGYWNDPVQTQARFLRHPQTGQTLYHTGDLGRYQPDGNIEFLGREDHQVKLRGFRIELGEIESALLNEPGIAQAAVIAREDTAGDKRLVAYLVPGQNSHGQAQEIDLLDLRQRLAARLPEYMIPAAFVVLDALPLTPNGKLDRQALPAPEGSGLAAGYVAPTTPEEVLLCDLVAELLGLNGLRENGPPAANHPGAQGATPAESGRELPKTLPSSLEEGWRAERRGGSDGDSSERQRVIPQAVHRVGLADNFFHLGGDSISSIRLVSRARERGLLITPRDVFHHPVLGDLVRVAQHEPDGPTDMASGVAEGSLPATPIIRRLLTQSGPWTGFSQAVMLQAPARLDETALAAALQALLDHHDALRLRVTPEGGLMIPPVGSVSAGACLRRLPLAGLDAAERLTALRRACDDATARLDPGAGILLQAVWAQGAPDEPGEPVRLLLAIHHLVIDGVSWHILESDLAQAYTAASTGHAIALPAKTTSFRHWAQRLASAAPQHRHELPFWHAMATRPTPALVAGTLDPARDTAGSARHLERTLPVETTTALLTTVPAAFHARINDVLLTALVLATAAWHRASGDSGSLALRLDLEGHGREPLDPSIDLTRTVGWFTSLYPLHLDPGALDLDDALAGGAAAGSALRRIKEQLRAVPAKGLGYGLLRYLDPDGAGQQEDCPPVANHPGAQGTTPPQLRRGVDFTSTTPVPLDAYSAPQIAFNYLGRLTTGHGADWQLATEAGALMGSAEAGLPLDHPIALNAVTHDTPAGPVLSATWSFAPALVSEAEASRLADAWSQALAALARHAARPETGGFTPSDLELVALEQTEIEALEQQHPGLEDIWPLTPLQEGLLFHAHYDREGEDPYLVQLALELEGRLDPARLRHALDALLRRHPNLRISFQQNRQGRPLQIVQGRCPMPWREHDLSGVEPEECDRQAAAIEAEDRRARFRLDQAPPIRATFLRLGPRRFSGVAPGFSPASAALKGGATFKLGQHRHRLLLTQHHLLGDGWSGPILLQDLLALYQNGGDGAELPPPPAFKDYLAWLQNQDKETARDAWQTYLAGIEAPTRLAPAIPGAAPIVQAQYEELLSAEFTARLETFARQHGLTLATLLQGAWTVLLSRLTNQSDVVYGHVSSGRQALVPGIERMLGLLITTTPARVRLSPTEPALDFLARLQREQAALLPHQHLSLTEIHKLAGHEVLFDTLFTYENYPVDQAAVPAGSDALPLRAVRGHNSNHYPLSFAAIPGPQLGLRLHYRADLFDHASAQRLAACLARLLEQIVDCHSAPLHRLDILAPEERNRLLHDFNDTTAAIPTATLVDRFGRQAAQTPDNIALTFQGQELSYAQLEARSNQLAWKLIASGIGPEDIVAICLERSPEMLVAILATLKAGAAYLPLDPDYPGERLAFMLRDARPKCLLTSSGLALADAGCCSGGLRPPDFRRAENPGTRIEYHTILQSSLDAPEVTTELAGYPTSAPTDADRTTPLRPGHPAYLIYTSGSTGTPKGVVISQQSITHYIDFVGSNILAQNTARMPLFTSSVFDLTLTTIFAPICADGQICIISQKNAQDALAEIFLRQEAASAVKLTPSHIALLSALPASKTAIATAIVGGEALTAAQVKTLEGRCPGIRIFNEYGPTETTIGAVGGYAYGQDIHIGTPYANTRVYVLDADLKPCPLGVTGELYIAGVGLARGYWDRPGLTAERFIANPFALEPGERLYRTGDLASWRADGNLLFHDRADQQLKIRGFRIEPGEIEASLLNEPGIAQAVVIAREDTAGDKRLVAYLVLSTGEVGQRQEIDLRDLRQRLAASLPEYMVPAAFVVLDALPLTPNGKLDRQALPAPEGSGLSAGYVAPTTPEETLLCDLVAELLGLERVGLADNFFHLGGHSLMATRLAAEVRKKLGRELSIRTIFEYPILQDLAKQIGLVTDSTTAFELLLPIRRRGSLPPLFCLHAEGGLCWPYTNLLRHTAEDQPIYGIQARGFSDDRSLPETLDDVITESVEQIRAVRAHGPYRLLGWSFGGILAHKIATRLQAEGERIDRLVVFDTYPPSAQRDHQMATGRAPRDVWRDLARATGLTIPPVPHGAPNIALDAEAILALAREQSHILGSLPLRQLQHIAAVMVNNSCLMTPAVKLDSFDGDMFLYVATRHAPGFDELRMNPKAWDPFCRGSIRTISVDAAHNELMSPDALEQIGELPLS